MKQLFSAGLALLAIVGLLSPAKAGDQVPFQGVAYPVFTSQTPVGGSLVLLTIDVSGNATQLGNFRGPATAILDLSTYCYTGSYFWTSPNGKDSIFGDFSGCLLPTDDPCVRTNVETITTTGGTGRFANATGAGIAGGTSNFCTGENVLPFTGTVSRPHSE